MGIELMMNLIIYTVKCFLIQYPPYSVTEPDMDKMNNDSLKLIKVGKTLSDIYQDVNNGCLSVLEYITSSEYTE